MFQGFWFDHLFDTNKSGVEPSLECGDDGDEHGRDVIAVNEVKPTLTQHEESSSASPGNPPTLVNLDTFTLVRTLCFGQEFLGTEQKLDEVCAGDGEGGIARGARGTRDKEEKSLCHWWADQGPELTQIRPIFQTRFESTRTRKQTSVCLFRLTMFTPYILIPQGCLLTI